MRYHIIQGLCNTVQLRRFKCKTLPYFVKSLNFPSFFACTLWSPPCLFSFQILDFYSNFRAPCPLVSLLSCRYLASSLPFLCFETLKVHIHPHMDFLVSSSTFQPHPANVGVRDGGRGEVLCPGSHFDFIFIC